MLSETTRSKGEGRICRCIKWEILLFCPNILESCLSKGSISFFFHDRNLSFIKTLETSTHCPYVSPLDLWTDKYNCSYNLAPLSFPDKR